MAHVGTCVFCEKPVDDADPNGWEGRRQVVYDGTDERGLLQKKPGKAIVMHGVCEVPCEAD